MKLPEILTALGALQAIDFIEVEQNMKIAHLSDDYDPITADENKRILDIVKVLHVTIVTARIEKQERLDVKNNIA